MFPIESKSLGDEKLPATVPIFPLANLVMYPKVVLPLHIFEMRYRAMTQAALASDRMIAMATIIPGHESQSEGNPPICPVGCVGRIMAEERLPDGRYNFLLQGVARVRFGLELPADPYRSAPIEPLLETPPEAAKASVLRSTLHSLLDILVVNDQFSAEAIEQFASEELSVGDITDLTSFLLLGEVRIKQQMLEELNVSHRAIRLAAILQDHIQRQGLKPRKPSAFREPNLN